VNISVVKKLSVCSSSGTASVRADDINLYTNTESIKKVILTCPYKGFEIPQDKDLGRDIVL